MGKRTVVSGERRYCIGWGQQDSEQCNFRAALRVHGREVSGCGFNVGTAGCRSSHVQCQGTGADWADVWIKWDEVLKDSAMKQEAWRRSGPMQGRVWADRFWKYAE